MTGPESKDVIDFEGATERLILAQLKAVSEKHGYPDVNKFSSEGMTSEFQPVETSDAGTVVGPSFAEIIEISADFEKAIVGTPLQKSIGVISTAIHETDEGKAYTIVIRRGVV